MSFRRRLMGKMLMQQKYDIDKLNLIDTSVWVDERHWNTATPCVMASYSGRCCYPLYISCDPSKTYRLYMTGGVSGLYCRVLDVNKNIIKSIQTYQNSTFTGASYVVLFSINSLSTYSASISTSNHAYFEEA